MDTIRTTVIIPADRRLRMEVTVPEGIPPGKAEVVLVISPVPPDQEGTPLTELAGCLADSPRFSRDPVTVQRELRDGWR